jgi:divalent metal cation (Fe/Co/Zn/Cd) transporter
MPIPIVERSDREIARDIEKRIRSIKDIGRCKVMEITSTRKKPTVRLLAVLKGNPSYEQTHRICSTMGIETRHVLFNVNLVIFSESSGLTNEEERAGKIVKAIADAEPGFRGSQNIHVRELDGELGVDFTLLEADALDAFHSFPTGRIEEKILASDSRISEVIIHEEPLSDLIHSQRAGHGGEAKWYVEHIVRRFPDFKLHLPPTIHKLGDQLHVTIRLSRTSRAHDENGEDLEKLVAAIRNGYPAITKVTIIE